MTDFAYTYRISPRFNDLDGNGHVNNTVFGDYVQEARGHYFRDLFGDHWRESSVVIATLTIDFLAQVYLEDEVAVDVRVTEVGSSSWTVEYRVRAIDPETGDARVAAEGSSVQVAWDPAVEETRDLPSAWRDRLEDDRVSPAE